MEEYDAIWNFLNLFGWPTFFILGLRLRWWHMGESGVDPEWKAIALRSISTNEELVSEVAQARQRRKSDG